MTLDQLLALASLLLALATVVGGMAWRAFHGIWTVYRRIEAEITSIRSLLWFHHQVLAWHDAAIEDLEEKRPA